MSGLDLKKNVHFLGNTFGPSPGSMFQYVWGGEKAVKSTGIKYRPVPFSVACVIRLSLGKLLVNLLQVVKRTNTPLNTLTNGVVDRPWVFWVVGSISTIRNNILFQIFPMSNLKNILPGIPRK